MIYFLLGMQFVLVYCSSSIAQRLTEKARTHILTLTIAHVDIGQRLFGSRIGGSLRKAPGILDLVLHLPVYGIQFLLGCEAAFEDEVAQPLDGVASAVRIDLFFCAVGDGIALEVAVIAVGLAFDQTWALAAPRPGNGLTGSLVDGQHIQAINGDAGHVIKI